MVQPHCSNLTLVTATFWGVGIFQIFKAVSWCLKHVSHDRTKPTKLVCVQQRLRSAMASTQSDQRFRCVLNGQLRTQAFFMRTAKTLIRVGRCKGWSESSLCAHSFCWFCHVVALVISFVNTNTIWATSRENILSGIFDQLKFKPACSATEAS